MSKLNPAEAKAAGDLLNELKIKTEWNAKEAKWQVQLFDTWLMYDEELIEFCKDKLAEYGPVETYPRCPDCKHEVDEYNVDENGVCSCDFCYCIGYEEQFNQGFIISRS